MAKSQAAFMPSKLGLYKRFSFAKYEPICGIVFDWIVELPCATLLLRCNRNTISAQAATL
jgi:hypothetical protein